VVISLNRVVPAQFADLERRICMSKCPVTFQAMTKPTGTFGTEGSSHHPLVTIECFSS
jgi:hypothetical protein